MHVLGYQPIRLLPTLQQKMFCSVLSKTVVTEDCEFRQRRVSRNPPQSGSQRSILYGKDALIMAVYQTSGICCDRKCWFDHEFWWPWMTVTLAFRCMMMHVYQGNAGPQYVNLAKQTYQIGTKVQNGHTKIRTTCLTLTLDLMTRKWYATHCPLMGCVCVMHEMNPSNRHEVKERPDENLKQLM